MSHQLITYRAEIRPGEDPRPGEEFYEVEDLALVMEELNRQLEEWEHTYNYIRPHETLDYLTPNEYYRRWKKIQKSQASLML